MPQYFQGCPQAADEALPTLLTAGLLLGRWLRIHLKVRRRLVASVFCVGVRY